MKAVVFDVKGTIAHFRRPDTTATHLTYPFITPLAAKGLVGAILGITDFMTRDHVGIQLLNPVRTSAQQLSMLGKDSGNTFNRPTTVELLVNPAYRIYYVGDEYVEELAESLKKRHYVYHTYLGVAYAITCPKFLQYYEKVDLIPAEEIVETCSVVPTNLIQKIFLQEDRYYSRAGGFMKDYLGERRFERSISFIYEKDGQSIKFQLKKNDNKECLVAQIGDKQICLV
ncbi:MAG TPA: type I-B CRISPR-associated protein Cas5b [Acetivibrio sp.]|jgi:CRISPR-associated protein Cas5h|nr:type I-B CRISPR-associated protein Cas5b [Acetivibrio sp.]